MGVGPVWSLTCDCRRSEPAICLRVGGGAVCDFFVQSFGTKSFDAAQIVDARARRMGSDLVWTLPALDPMRQPFTRSRVQPPG